MKWEMYFRPEYKPNGNDSVERDYKIIKAIANRGWLLGAINCYMLPKTGEMSVLPAKGGVQMYMG